MSIVRQTSIAPRASLAMGAAGAIVGGAVAAARDIDKVKKGDMTREEAVKDVLKESGTTGLATAAATAVVSSLGLTGVLSLAGLVAVAVGTKRLADKALAKCETKRLAEGESEASEPLKSAPAKKSTTKKDGAAAKA
ncbi:MAG: hypothetical protein PWQ57_93 [Desulfovibrionales bacterium]|nr:hypothetical protein [Desulfovibrionales bacterium]